MPTAKIIWYKGAAYHITTRGNHRNDIFKDEEDFQVYLTQVEENFNYYNYLNYKLIAYCLIDNHVHLNPVKANMVEKPEEYKWSSYSMFIRKSSKELVNSEIILNYFNNKDEHKLYKEFVECKIQNKA